MLTVPLPAAIHTFTVAVEATRKLTNEVQIYNQHGSWRRVHARELAETDRESGWI
jgi:hypothetical protein